MNPWGRVRLALIGIAIVLTVGSAGYMLLGMTPLDAVYQTVTTVTTVGFREVEPFSGAGKIFTIGVCLVGVGTVLYTFGVLVEALVEGHISKEFGRRRMQRKVEELKDHVIVCGWGRVGRALAEHIAGSDDLVVIDSDPDRIASVPHLTVHGDATDDDVLRSAGIAKARALVAALNGDADNLFVTVSGRALRPDLFIVARVRTVDAEEKMRRAGADRVVNPQQIGGHRMAAFVMQPHVVEFLDVVMHDGSLEFRLEEVRVPDWSSLAGRTLRDSEIRDRSGALVLAIRGDDGGFRSNPSADTTVTAGDILIAIGTAEQHSLLKQLVRES
jgi:voltage-gated potassium channel